MKIKQISFNIKRVYNNSSPLLRATGRAPSDPHLIPDIFPTFSQSFASRLCKLILMKNASQTPNFKDTDPNSTLNVPGSHFIHL